jgi:long-chain acyl-CoA synthetase
LIKPTIFISVPRLLNRIYTAILQKAVHSGSFIKSRLFLLALEKKKQYIEKYNRLDHPIWDRLVFNKVKEALGGRVRIIISGSAPISGEVLSFLRACFSCQVSEGWGQTETAAPCSCNLLGDYEAGGCVGPVAVW